MLYRDEIGVVFQSFRLIQRKTIYENVAYLPRILGLDRSARPRAAQSEALSLEGGKSPDQPGDRADQDQARQLVGAEELLGEDR